MYEMLKNRNFLGGAAPPPMGRRYPLPILHLLRRLPRLSSPSPDAEPSHFSFLSDAYAVDHDLLSPWSWSSGPGCQVRHVSSRLCGWYTAACTSIIVTTKSRHPSTNLSAASWTSATGYPPTGWSSTRIRRNCCSPAQDTVAPRWVAGIPYSS